ncbi:DNA mismatch repair protein MutS [Taibaiella sp. KBW10]|uniref:endonuclease MutS2 n=1 Tax=Taibaiella sp. KBW10 TaxID=2153357 RepID=UPI000F5A6B5A|nr:DNA mismatch repair protein MutS [Taibaiella sp. KBW10]RQO32674.1 DNA mismatch repair protein MutS [Taibaiella sp. KBW10]
MLQFYPEQALERLEFEKIRQLLLSKCRTTYAKNTVQHLKFHTKKEYLELALLQVHEYKQTLGGNDYFPNDFTKDISSELKLLRIPGAVLNGDDILALNQLTITIRDILLWLKRQNNLYPSLETIAISVVYQKEIPKIINEMIDDAGVVRDTASTELMQIRSDIEKKRQQLRKAFEGILRKLNKQGYLADISESFMNGRRTVAVVAEQKRIVKGIMHGESESGKTVFIEPEETIELNNDLNSLEREEGREVYRILKELTAQLSVYHPHFESYFKLCGVYDFIRAKAILAKDLNAFMPRISPHPGTHLIKAYHPLLLLHNKEAGKITHPLTISIDKDNRILMISGPNAGGKTVSMKTIGLLQAMCQAGMLIPADDTSEVGIFKQIMIHIGDTQSIENELSTYSAHLRDMKYFLEHANSKTLFFVDELGSGSDPNLGGAFAEAIVEQLSNKKAMGIITTHYLNLKVMAGKVPGIFNGAMAFDEENLLPLYQLVLGKPGSSYTFSIAQRSGLPEPVINRARQITDKGHFKLDKMLHQTEQQSVRLTGKERSLDQLIKENEKLKSKYEELIDKERLEQHYQTLKLQNKIKKEELDYLRDTERKFKQIVFDWKRAENKQEVIEAAEKILFKKKHIIQNQVAATKADKNYIITAKEPQIGDLMRNKDNHQIGRLMEVKGKKAVIRIGHMPFSVTLEEWITVEAKKPQPRKKKVD